MGFEGADTGQCRNNPPSTPIPAVRDVLPKASPLGVRLSTLRCAKVMIVEGIRQGESIHVQDKGQRKGCLSDHVNPDLPRETPTAPFHFEDIRQSCGIASRIPCVMKIERA